MLRARFSESDRPLLYAAYGSNLHPTRLAQRVRSARKIGTGFVPDWSLNCHKRSKDGSAKFNIVAGGNGVYVAVFDISADDKINLDRIEGVGSGYRTVDLSVPQIGDCATYVAEDSHVDESLRPYEWYKKLAILGACAQCFPDAYVRLIDQIPTSEDPDKARHATNWRLVEAIESGSRPDAL